MQKVEDLRSGWEAEQTQAKAAAEKRGQKKAPAAPEFIDNSEQLEEDTGDAPAPSTAGLFDDSDSDDDDDMGKKEEETVDKETKEIAEKTSQQDLFGDSSDEESDEELKPTSGTKRGSDAKHDDDDGPSAKKAKTGDLEDSD